MKSSALRWFAWFLIFMFVASGTCIVVDKLIERMGDIPSVAESLAIALSGGGLTWLSLILLRQSHKLMCAAVMGLFTAIAGVGGFFLVYYLLIALSPHGGISNSI